MQTLSDTGDDKSNGVLPRFTDDDLRRLIEISPIPAFVTDNDGNFADVNSAACKFLDHSSKELTGKNISDVLANDEGLRLYVKLQLEGGKETGGSWQFLQKDGSNVWGDVTWRNLAGGRRLFFVNDTTQRKLGEQSLREAEKRRSQVQRVEALGRLAGGVAHDFNNFLAVIMLHVDILNRQLPDDSPIHSRVNEIRDVCNKVAVIVRQLLAFGRKHPINLTPTALNQVIRRFADNFSSVTDDGIEIELDLAPDLGVCFVDQTQIVQVLTNLAVNAKEAMPAGGILRIESSNIEIDRDAAREPQPGGPYIQITVSDTGVGMSTTTKDYIFEPFFSTKESDKGAGLALAMVYGIVKQSRGFIWVESIPGDGTSFKIQFPRIDQPAAIEPKKPDPREFVREGTETILLVDDENAVRSVTAELLRMSGYDVLEAGGGLEALEIAQAHIGQIHLLLTDYSMPVMNGGQVAEKVTNLHPETSVLFMSGNVDNIISSKANAGKVNFIGKPFSSSGLIQKIREIFEQ